MTLRLLCIANPLAYQGKGTDVPISYARLAADPAIRLFHADTEAVFEGMETLQAVPVPSSFDASQFDRLAQLPTASYPLTAFDLAFCRTLKPFAPGYLDKLMGMAKALPFVNNPQGIRRHLALDFLPRIAAPYLPPFQVTANVSDAEAFLATHGSLVAKRGNSCGGRGVYRVTAHRDHIKADNLVAASRCFDSAAACFAQLFKSKEPMLLMRYLPRVVEGERRLVVVAGDIFGSYLRRSPRGHWLQNVSAGATCEPTAIEDADLALVGHVAPRYQAMGVHLLGIDLIRDDTGDWRISEINAGNIGGIFRLEVLGQSGITERFVGWLGQLKHQLELE